MITGWLDSMVGDRVDDRPALTRALVSTVAEDVAAEQAETERQAQQADISENRLLSLRAAGQVPGQALAQGMELGDIDADIADLEAKLGKLRIRRSALVNAIRFNAEQVSLASEALTRSATITGNPDLLAPAREALRDAGDRQLVKMRAATALASIERDRRHAVVRARRARRG